jgi:hypothetical protein
VKQRSSLGVRPMRMRVLGKKRQRNVSPMSSFFVCRNLSLFFVFLTRDVPETHTKVRGPRRESSYLILCFLSSPFATCSRGKKKENSSCSRNLFQEQHTHTLKGAHVCKRNTSSRSFLMVCCAECATRTPKTSAAPHRARTDVRVRAQRPTDSPRAAASPPTCDGRSGG